MNFMSELRKLMMDREAWRAVIHGVAKSRTQLSNWTEARHKGTVHNVTLLANFFGFVLEKGVIFHKNINMFWVYFFNELKSYNVNV